MKYLYFAKIKGNAITCQSIGCLVNKINEEFQYPILSIDKANNLFLRPHKMKKVVQALSQFEIRREPTISSNQYPSG